MQTNKNLDGSLTLLAWDIATYTKGVADCTKDGYKLDLDSNEYYPQQLGGLFTVTFKPKEQDEELVKSKEDAPEIKGYAGLVISDEVPSLPVVESTQVYTTPTVEENTPIVETGKVAPQVQEKPTKAQKEPRHRQK